MGKKISSFPQKSCEQQQIYMEGDLIAVTNKKLRKRYRRHPEQFLHQLREERFNLRYRITDPKNNYEALADPHTSYYFSTASVRQHLKRFKKAIRNEQANQSQKTKVNKLLTIRLSQKFSDHISPNTAVYEKELLRQDIQILHKKSSTNLVKKRSKKSLKSDHSNENLTYHGFSSRKRHSVQHKQMGFTVQVEGSESQYPKIQPKQLLKQEKERSTSNEKKTLKTPRLNAHLHRSKRQETTHNLPDSQGSVFSRRSQQLRLKTSSKESNEQRELSNRLAEELHKKKHDKWLKFLEEKKQLLNKIKDQSNPEES